MCVYSLLQSILYYSREYGVLYAVLLYEAQGDCDVDIGISAKFIISGKSTHFTAKHRRNIYTRMCTQQIK